MLEYYKEHYLNHKANNNIKAWMGLPLIVTHWDQFYDNTLNTA